MTSAPTQRVELRHVNRRRGPRQANFGELIGFSYTSGDSMRRTGWTRDISPTGLSFVVENGQAPQINDQLQIFRKLQRESGTFRVVRAGPSSPLTTLVACEKMTAYPWAPVQMPDFLEAHPQPTKSSASVNGNEKADEPTNDERRRSSRWLTNKIIQWRLSDDSRQFSGYVVERSLQGMVIAVSKSNCPEPSAIIRPASPSMGNRHGFAAAMLRRVEQDAAGQCLMFVEILS